MILSVELRSVLVLAAQNDDYEAITVDGLEHYRMLENKLDRFKLEFIAGASHSIHKSKSHQFVSEVYRFYTQEDIIPTAVKRKVKYFMKNGLNLNDFLKMYFEPNMEPSPVLTTLIMNQFIQDIKSINSLFHQLKSIWQFKDVDVEKCRVLTRFYQDSRSWLLKSIYSKKYFSQVAGLRFSIGRYKVSQLEWVLVNRHANPAFHKRKEFCFDSYGEMFGVSMCMDHPIENVSFSQIDTQFIGALAREQIFVKLPTEELIKKEEGLVKREIKKIKDVEKRSKRLKNGSMSEDFFERLFLKLGTGLENYIWCEENSNNQTQPIDSKLPIANIFDLAGNTTEFHR